MKKKILLTLTLLAIFVCLFAVAVSAAQIAGYQQFEVELVDGSKITVYESADWDQWQGRLNFTDATYTEPPLDTESTYPFLDWSQVAVVDFTNGHRMQLDANTGEYVETYGTNGSMHLSKTNFTPANATSLKKIITGNVNIIRGATIAGFPALEEIVCSEKLVEIQWNGCQNNYKLKTVDFSACTNFTTFGQQAFIGCTGLETITLPNTITSMGSSVFQNCTSLKSINWPTNMTTIPSSTFNGCTSLSEFTIPDNITTLGNFSFQGCSALKNVNISANSQISNKWISIFRGCTNLESIFIPPLVTEIGYDNFWDCNSLKQITFSEGLESISGGNNFAACSSLEKIVFPNSMTTLAAGNFSSCTALKEIRFGNSLTKLSDGTLAYLHALERVYIPASVESIGDHILGYSNSADSADNVTLIFTGTMEQAAALQLALKTYTEENAPGHIPNSSKFYNAELVSAKEYDADTTAPSGYHLVYGYSACKAFYNDEHRHGAEQEKFLGAEYLTDYVIATTCQRCNENVIKETIATAIFTNKGYSYANYGTGKSFTFGISLNEQSYSDYIAHNPDANIQFGFIIGSVESDDNQILNANGTSKLSNYIITDFTDTNYQNLNRYDLIMHGIGDDDVEMQFYCGAYVIEDSSIYYIGNTTTTKAVPITYDKLPVVNS